MADLPIPCMSLNMTVRTIIEMIFFFSTLGVDSTSVTNKNDLLSEIQILKQAGRHPNIVNLVGACTQEGKLPTSQHVN